MTKNWAPPTLQCPYAKQQNFRQVQVEIFCRKQVIEKLKFVFGRVENIVGKGERRKCWLSPFSPFPTMFSKSLFLRVAKSGDCVLKD